MAALGVTATIELTPAGTLTALVRRELPAVTTLALNGPDDLAAARDLIAEHGTELADTPMPWQLVVAPAQGTVRVPEGSPRTAVAAGDVVVHVSTRTDEVAVRVERAGHLVEWLVADGDPVSAGQPLARVVAGVSA
jgi:[acyl-carrier-protein] S-malonyltransferase